jgi:hypothetical protein
VAAKKKELESHIVEISGFRSIVSYLEDTNDWLFSVGESQKVFSDMMCDGRIESLVGDRKDRVQQLTGSITPTGNRAVDEACDRYVNFNARYEAQSILLNAIPYGIAVCEIIWEKRNGIYAPASFVPVPRQALSFPQDGEYMTPYLTAENKPLNEPYKFLVHRNSTGDGSRWGTPALKSAYWPWKFKRLGFKFWIMAAEKVGVPSVLALFQSKTTEDARARAKALSEELRNLESGSSGAFGNVADIKVVDSEIKDFDAIVSTCNTEIALRDNGTEPRDESGGLRHEGAGDDARKNIRLGNERRRLLHAADAAKAVRFFRRNKLPRRRSSHIRHRQHRLRVVGDGARRDRPGRAGVAFFAL